MTTTIRNSLRRSIALFTFLLTLFASPAFAVPQEGTSEPGVGLTAIETVLYFVLAPFGLFLAIVVIGYALHRPRDQKSRAVNSLTEIR